MKAAGPDSIILQEINRARPKPWTRAPVPPIIDIFPLNLHLTIVLHLLSRSIFLARIFRRAPLGLALLSFVALIGSFFLPRAARLPPVVAFGPPKFVLLGSTKRTPKYSQECFLGAASWIRLSGSLRARSILICPLFCRLHNLPFAFFLKTPQLKFLFLACQYSSLSLREGGWLCWYMNFFAWMSRMGSRTCVLWALTGWQDVLPGRLEPFFESCLWIGLCPPFRDGVPHGLYGSTLSPYGP